MASDLDLAGLRGLREANGILDFDSVYGISDFVSVIHVNQILTSRHKYIGIFKSVPSFSSRIAPKVLRARS